MRLGGGRGGALSRGRVQAIERSRHLHLLRRQKLCVQLEARPRCIWQRRICARRRYSTEVEWGPRDLGFRLGLLRLRHRSNIATVIGVPMELGPRSRPCGLPPRPGTHDRRNGGGGADNGRRGHCDTLHREQLQLVPEAGNDLLKVSFYYISEDTSCYTFAAAAVLGLGSSLLLPTVQTMAADLITDERTDSGATAFSVISFVDKMANGCIIMAIQALHPSCDCEGHCTAVDHGCRATWRHRDRVGRPLTAVDLDRSAPAGHNHVVA